MLLKTIGSLASKITISSTKQLFINARYMRSGVPYSADSFYDWNDPLTLERVIKEEYVLKDLEKGWIALKYRMEIQNRSLYTQKQLHFLVYASMLLQDSQIIRDCLDGIKNCEALSSNKQNIPTYLIQAKHLLKLDLQSHYLDQVKEILANRLFHPNNCTSLQSMHDTLQLLAFPNAEGYFQLVQEFKNKMAERLRQRNFILTKLEIKCIIETLDILNQNCYDIIRRQAIFSELPEFEHSEEVFQNLLGFLVQIFTQNVLYRSYKKDIQLLHRRFHTCLHYNSPKTKKLLNQYSCHLVAVGHIELLNFNKLLNPI